MAIPKTHSDRACAAARLAAWSYIDDKEARDQLIQNEFGKNIYKVKHLPTQQEIYVSNGDIKR